MQAKSICEWCGQEYWKAKDWQRFHHPKCRDDWHNHQKKMALVEMSGFRPTEEQRQAAMEALPTMKKADVPNAPHPWRKRFSHKPLAEVMKSLKEPTEPQVQQQAPLQRRSLG